MRGGNNLARLLCLKMTGKLSEKIGAINAACLPEKYAEEQTVILSAAQIPLRVGRDLTALHKAEHSLQPQATSGLGI